MLVARETLKALLHLHYKAFTLLNIFEDFLEVCEGF